MKAVTPLRCTHGGTSHCWDAEATPCACGAELTADAATARLWAYDDLLAMVSFVVEPALAHTAAYRFPDQQRQQAALEVVRRAIAKAEAAA